MLAFAAVVLTIGAAPLRVAAPGLNGVGVDEKLTAFYGEHVAQELKNAGVEVFTTREIASLLGLERQKQLLGCADSATSCAAELGNALGADAVLLGDLASFGDKVQLNLKLIRTSDGKTLATYSDRPGAGEPVLDSLSRAAGALTSEAYRALNRAPPERPSAGTSGRLLRWSIAPGVLGVFLAGTGAALWAVSTGQYRRLTTENVGAEGAMLRSSGTLNQTLGVAGVTAGIVALAVAVALIIVDRVGG